MAAVRMVCVALGLSGGLLAGAAPSFAQGKTEATAIAPELDRAEHGDSPPSDARDRALHLFEQSEALYRRGDFGGAVALLQQAYLTFPEPVLLYNLGRAYEGAGNADGAIEAYERYLVADPGLKDRAALELRLNALREQVRLGELQKQPPAAASAPSREPTESTRPLASGEQTKRERKALSPVPWVVAGVGIAAIGAGTVLWLAARERHGEAQAEPDAAKSATLQHEAENLAVAASVGAIAGVVIAGAGVTWGVVALRSSSPDKRAAARIVLGVGPGIATVGGQF